MRSSGCGGGKLRSLAVELLDIERLLGWSQRAVQVYVFMADCFASDWLVEERNNGRSFMGELARRDP